MDSAIAAFGPFFLLLFIARLIYCHYLELYSLKRISGQGWFYSHGFSYRYLCRVFSLFIDLMIFYI